MRLPGEHGPVVRCSGDLSWATAASLRRELALPLPAGSSALTLNLSGCSFLDVEGMMTLIDSFKRLRQEGHRLVLVAGPGTLSRLLQVTGIDRVIPMFPTEEAAAWALRGGRPPERTHATARCGGAAASGGR
jgi:anti-anti-sigma factor